VVSASGYTFMTKCRHRLATATRAPFRRLSAAPRTQYTPVPTVEKLSGWIEHKLNVNVETVGQFGRNRRQRLGPPNGLDRFLIEHGLT
jgi:hypothetical protein